MQLLHSAARTHASFDDPNLVSCAGLVPVMRLAQACGLVGLLARWVRIGTSVGTNPADKITSIIAGMVTGADCIDDLDVVRHGGMAALFGGVYAPSTLGSFCGSSPSVMCGSWVLSHGGFWSNWPVPPRYWAVPRR